MRSSSLACEASVVWTLLLILKGNPLSFGSASLSAGFLGCLVRLRMPKMTIMQARITTDAISAMVVGSFSSPNAN